MKHPHIVEYNQLPLWMFYFQSVCSRSLLQSRLKGPPGNVVLLHSLYRCNKWTFKRRRPDYLHDFSSLWMHMNVWRTVIELRGSLAIHVQFHKSCRNLHKALEGSWRICAKLLSGEECIQKQAVTTLDVRTKR